VIDTPKDPSYRHCPVASSTLNAAAAAAAVTVAFRFVPLSSTAVKSLARQDPAICSLGDQDDVSTQAYYCEDGREMRRSDNGGPDELERCRPPIENTHHYVAATIFAVAFVIATITKTTRDDGLTD